MTDYSYEQRMLLESGKAVALTVDGYYPGKCPNCNDLHSVFVFEIKNGPFQSPNGGSVKYLDQNSGKEPGWYSGETKGASCPACANGRLRDWLKTKCGLDGKDLYENISTFVPDEGKTEAHQVAMNILAMNGEPRGFVTFWGSYGVGKSKLLKCLVNGFVGMNVMARYTTANNMLTEIKNSWGDDRDVTKEIIESLARFKVLCIDEFDKFQLTNWSHATIFSILDGRYNAADRFLTVIASNKSPDELPTELGYLRSRMCGGSIIEVGGDDYRPVVAEFTV